MGEKILAANVVGSALTQEQVSHYEPRTPHCYVELHVYTADLTKADYNIRYLYDGQTNELLAASGVENGKMIKMVFVTGALTNDADDYIGQMMTDKDR